MGYVLKIIEIFKKMFNVFSYIPHIPIYVEDFYTIEYLGLTQKFLEKN